LLQGKIEILSIEAHLIPRTGKVVKCAATFVTPVGYLNAAAWRGNGPTPDRDRRY
jgi:hypothetical protein